LGELKNNFLIFPCLVGFLLCQEAAMGVVPVDEGLQEGVPEEPQRERADD
jgi:hypothetical protein